MIPMTKRERLEATVAGGDVDRPAVALWRHWPGDDQHPEEFASSTVGFQRALDFDFVKCMPASTYCIADWGATGRYVGNEEGTPQYGPRVIQRPEDWSRLRMLDPRRGSLGTQLNALELIGKGLDGVAPFIESVWSPLAQAKNLAGERILSDLRQYPTALKEALEVITESTIRFILAAREKGIAGIFLALQHASYDLLSQAEYREFGRPYDLRVLEAARSLWFNVLHVHGNNIMFREVADYPVQAINWHDRETAPSLSQALNLFPGALIGGIRQVDTLVRGTPDDIHSEVRDALTSTGGKRLVVGTGCVTWITTPAGNIRAVRSAVER